MTRAADAGVDGLLLEVGRGEPLEAFARRLLGPLIDYDARHGGDLVGTLEAYLASWGQLRRCAASLYVHPNTLKYRIGRIGSILGVDPRDPAVRTDLLLACHAHRVARALAAPAPMTSCPPVRLSSRRGGDERRRTTM